MADNMKIVIDVDDTRAKASIDGISSGLKEIEPSAQSATSSLKASFAEIAGAAAVLTATVAVIKKSVDAATEFQNALNGMASVARYAGQDIQSTLGKAVALTGDGMLSTTEAATALKNLLAKGFTTDQAVEMINRFKDSAAFGRQASLGFGEAVVTATEGIKNNISNLVDNAGVTKNISVMQKEYADSIGITVGKLTEAQQRQAIYVGVLRETEGQLGNAAIAADGMTGSQARLAKATNDAAVSFGKALTPAVSGATDFMASSITAVSENVIKPFLFLFSGIGITAAEAMAKVGLAFEVMSTPSTWWNDREQDAIKARFKKLGEIAEESRMQVVESLNNPIDVNIGKDSGKRREDVAQPGIDTSKQDAARAESIAKMIQSESDKYDRLNQMAIEATATANDRVAWKLAFDLESMDKDRQRSIDNHAWNASLEEKYNDAKLNREQQAYADLKKIKDVADKEDKKNKDAIVKEDLKRETDRIANLTGVARIAANIKRGEVTQALDMAVQMTAGVAQHSRTMFEINKAASIASITVKGYKAAMDAYAEGGPFLGPVLAGISALFTATQIAGVSSTEFGGGGTVGGTPTVPSTSGAAQYNNSPPPAPTQAVATIAPKEVNFYGVGQGLSLVNMDQFMRDHMIPALNSAVGDGVVFNYKG